VHVHVHGIGMVMVMVDGGWWRHIETQNQNPGPSGLR